VPYYVRKNIIWVALAESGEKRALVVKTVVFRKYLVDNLIESVV
jgi:hypothetical protein